MRGSLERAAWLGWVREGCERDGHRRDDRAGGRSDPCCDDHPPHGQGRAVMRNERSCEPGHKEARALIRLPIRGGSGMRGGHRSGVLESTSARKPSGSRMAAGDRRDGTTDRSVRPLRSLRGRRTRKGPVPRCRGAVPRPCRRYGMRPQGPGRSEPHRLPGRAADLNLCLKEHSRRESKFPGRNSERQTAGQEEGGVGAQILFAAATRLIYERIGCLASAALVRAGT